MAPVDRYGIDDHTGGSDVLGDLEIRDTLGVHVGESDSCFVY